MAKEKIRIIVGCGIYALLCAPLYKHVGFYSDLPHPRTNNPTKKSCGQKRIPTSTYVGSGTKQEVTYHSEIPAVVKLGDVNGNTTIVGFCR